MVSELTPELAKQLQSREGGLSGKNTHRVNPYGYFGDFQIGVNYAGHKHTEWTDWGGKQEDVPSASHDVQYQVAKTGWARKSRAVGSDDPATVYAAWNIGEGTVKKILANPNGTIGATGTMKLIHTQAWGKNLGADCTNAKALQLCKDYWNKGKTDATVGPSNPTNGQPEWVQPAVNDGGGKDGIQGGTFGGTIKLWLKKNSYDSSEFRWTTIANDNVSDIFYIPCVIGIAGDDQFINKWGEAGPLATDPDTGNPVALTGSIMGYLIPLSLGQAL